MINNKKKNAKTITYTLTFVQNGDYEWFTLRTHDVAMAIHCFVTAGIESFPQNCRYHTLFANDKLIARQATYQGV